jgi:large subunit ribosomal protein L22
MEIKASAKFIRQSPKKVRLVANLVKGLPVAEALTQLKFNAKAAAGAVAKLLKSAISNAEENHGLRRDNLFIKAVRVDGGPTLKRWTPKAFGRATPIVRRSSHVSLLLAEREPTAVTAKPKAVDDSDIIKLGDFEELKKLNKVAGDKAEVEVIQDKKKSAGKNKGFISKVFNRKSG